MQLPLLLNMGGQKQIESILIDPWLFSQQILNNILCVLIAIKGTLLALENMAN